MKGTSDLRWQLLATALLAMLIFLQYHLWFAPGGLCDWWQLKKKLSQQMRENTSLKKRNDLLSFQVRRLQNSQDAVEARARSELGMIKNNETYYQIVK